MSGKHYEYSTTKQNKLTTKQAYSQRQRLLYMYLLYTGSLPQSQAPHISHSRSLKTIGERDEIKKNSF